MARRRLVGLEGGEELGRKLRSLDDEMSGAHLLEAALEGSEVIRASASARAPRDEGVLAENIDTAAVSAKRDRAVTHVGPNAKAWHGIFPELGTSHSAAKPYLRPAMDEDGDQAVKAIADSLRQGLRSVTGGGA